MSIAKIVKMMFEYYRQYRTYYQIEAVTMSAKVVDIDIGYVEEVLIIAGKILDGNRYY